MSRRPSALCSIPKGLAVVFMAVVWAAFACSCASTSGADRAREREPHAPLIVARSGNEALLSWQSQLGEHYTVLFADGRRHGVEWQPLPGASRILGNGQEIRLTDKMRPGVPRYYRLMVTPADGRARSSRR